MSSLRRHLAIFGVGAALVGGCGESTDASKSASPSALQTFETDDRVLLDAWLKTLDTELPDAALTKAALDLLGRGIGGCVARWRWEEGEKAGSLPSGRVRSNASRVLAHIARWESTEMSEAEHWRAEQRLKDTWDTDVMCLALLANVPMPGHTAYQAMDALERAHDAASLRYLQAARHVLTAVAYPGDGIPTREITQRLNMLIARIESESGRR